MKKRVGMNIRKWLWCLGFVLLFIGTMPKCVQADSGPKPSVTVTIEGCEEETYYATLLSSSSNVGPFSVSDAYTPKSPEDETYDIWESFVTYKDSDGYYFLQEYWECSGNDEFKWGYHPPSSFKILLYFPEQDTFMVSEIYERYAFRAYYTIDMTNVEILPGEVIEQVPVEKSYRYFWELFSLILRTIFTIWVEYTIAKCFFRMKKTLHIFVMVNILTQLILNIILNVIDYYEGFYLQCFTYIMAEFWVFVIEAVIYSVIFVKSYCDMRQIRRAILYAFIANLASFVVGMIVLYFIENISYRYDDLLMRINRT